jgi:hydroxymethylpyrimidine pyrophosphatase-like HAD family hydrolase
MLIFYVLLFNWWRLKMAEDKRPLFLFDVDETLVGTDNLFNTTAFPEAVRRAQAQGWLVGLNSDAPVIRLAERAREWGLDGPIVAELGSIIVPNPHDLTPIWQDIRHMGVFNKIRGEFLQRGLAEHPDAIFTLSDKEEVLLALENMTPETVKSWVILHGLRQHSLAFYAYKVGPRGIAFDLPRLKSLAGLAAHLFEQTTRKNPLIDVNDDYGICIIHEPRASKRKAVRALKENFGQIVMVGNSMSDFLNSPTIVQCAVYNAHQELKKRSDYVAISPLTTGAIECLDWALATLK